MAGTMQPVLRHHLAHRWFLAEFSPIDMSCLSPCQEIFPKRHTVWHSSAPVSCIPRQTLSHITSVVTTVMSNAPFLLQSMVFIQNGQIQGSFGNLKGRVHCDGDAKGCVQPINSVCGLLLFLPCMKYRSLYIVESKERTVDLASFCWWRKGI